MNNQPNTGDIATCSGCGMKIQFDGQEWKHLSVHFKHPAEPVAPRRIDTAILQQPVQCQVEADDDCVWA